MYYIPLLIMYISVNLPILFFSKVITQIETNRSKPQAIFLYSTRVLYGHNSNGVRG